MLVLFKFLLLRSFAMMISYSHIKEDDDYFKYYNGSYIGKFKLEIQKYYKEYMEKFLECCYSDILEIKGMRKRSWWASNDFKEPKQPDDVPCNIPDPYYYDIYQKYVSINGVTVLFAQLLAIRDFYKIDTFSTWAYAVRDSFPEWKVIEYVERYKEALKDHSDDPFSKLDDVLVSDNICY